LVEGDPAESPPVVVFDFDGTLFDGDLGYEWLRWRLLRAPWRLALLMVLLPLWAPLFARKRWLRHGVAVCFGAATLGEPRAHPREFLDRHADRLRGRLLPAPLATLQAHRQRGDTVLIATGAFPPLVEGLLAQLPGGAPPVFGSTLEPGRWAARLRVHLQGGHKLKALAAAGHAARIAMVYTDSLADLPLLRASERGVLVARREDQPRLQRRLARQSGLPPLDWMLR